MKNARLSRIGNLVRRDITAVHQQCSDILDIPNKASKEYKHAKERPWERPRKKTGLICLPLLIQHPGVIAEVKFAAEIGLGNGWDALPTGGGTRRCELKRLLLTCPRSLNRVSDPVSRLAKGRISSRARMLYFYGIKEHKDHEPSD